MSAFCLKADISRLVIRLTPVLPADLARPALDAGSAVFAIKFCSTSDGSRAALVGEADLALHVDLDLAHRDIRLARATPSGTMAIPTPAATSAIAQSSDSAIAAGCRDTDAARPKKSLCSQ